MIKTKQDIKNTAFFNEIYPRQISDKQYGKKLGLVALIFVVLTILAIVI